MKIKGLSDDDIAPVESHLEINRAVAEPRTAAPGVLSRCIGVGKLKAIKSLMAIRCVVFPISLHAYGLGASRDINRRLCVTAALCVCTHVGFLCC